MRSYDFELGCRHQRDRHDGILQKSAFEIGELDMILTAHAVDASHVELVDNVKFVLWLLRLTLFVSTFSLLSSLVIFWIKQLPLPNRAFRVTSNLAFAQLIGLWRVSEDVESTWRNSWLVYIAALLLFRI